MLNSLLPYRRRRRTIQEIEDGIMLVDNTLKAVAFLCQDRTVDGQKQRVPIATCFAVSFPCPCDPNTSVCYVVTARHPIESAGDSQLFVRANTKDGKFVDHEVSALDWIKHDDADVALIPFSKAWNYVDMDIVPIPTNAFIGGGPHYKYKNPKSPGGGFDLYVGMEVTVAGLFTSDYGDDKNLPISRFGRISRMPSLVNVQRWKGDETRRAAYLVEMLSTGGLSGSPAFAMRPLQFPINKNGKLISVVPGFEQVFLGVVAGHYQSHEVVETVGDVLGTIRSKINTGIAMITPSEAVMQLLLNDELVQSRDESCRRRDNSSVEMD